MHRCHFDKCWNFRLLFYWLEVFFQLSVQCESSFFDFLFSCFSGSYEYVLSVVFVCIIFIKVLVLRALKRVFTDPLEFFILEIFFYQSWNRRFLQFFTFQIWNWCRDKSGLQYFFCSFLDIALSSLLHFFKRFLTRLWMNGLILYR